MSKTNINYTEFIKYVHEHFKEDIELDDIKEILHLEQGYNRDSPESIGKYLLLNRLIFSGDKKNNISFKFYQNLYSGINLWIADNFKGKSSVFKIIKFALTGAESYKPDIKNWLKEIILEFQIGEAVYTIFIDKRGRDKGALYTFGIERFLELRDTNKLNGIELEKEFDFKSKKMLEEHLEDFFFDHFSFYRLKYTQKSSSKENFELSTSNLSWATYFKSIYLEASNYEYLFFENEKFGAQGRKIFEMILGLPLTYPINMLSLQSDTISEKIGKLRLADKSITEAKINARERIEKEYRKVISDLEQLRKDGKITFNDEPLIKEYARIQERVSTNLKKRRSANENYLLEQKKVQPIKDEIENLQNDRNRVNSEISRLEKQALNLKLYKEAGSFFSNLDIKVCPHCENEVTDERKKNEHFNHECSLCGETSNQQKVEEEELTQKFTRILEEQESHRDKLNKLKDTIREQEKKLKVQIESVSENYSKLVAVPSTDSDIKRLKEIEKQIDAINEKRKKQQTLIAKEQSLIKKEAVLKFQLNEINKKKNSDSSQQLSRLSLHKKIIEYALQSLHKKRIKLNEDILEKLENLILNEVQSFGLSNIEKIRINDKYEIVFTQNDVEQGFNELTEGEKLRAKLAFYLSIIQLDIEHKLGRHPRFLIFDSPGGEEMIEKHLHGLSEILKSVNERFRDELQIFVGSALREFSDITESEKAVIKNDDEFIF